MAETIFVVDDEEEFAELLEVVSSEELFEAVWQEKYYDCNNTVMAHIARLREKLKENARKPKFIKTVWGVGYKIDAE